MLGNLRRQLGELGLGLAQGLLRAVEAGARFALAVARGRLGGGKRFDLGSEIDEDLPRFGDQRLLAGRIAAELLATRTQLALALGGTRGLALEILLLDAQPAEDGGALAFLLAQRVHALGKARLLGERLRIRFRCRGELRQRIAQVAFLAIDVRLRVGPREVQQEGVLAADLVGDFLVAPRRARLPLEAFDLAVELAEHVAEPREVRFGRLQAQLGLVAAAVQAGDAGRILEDAAALLGLGVDDLADLPLPHQCRRARAGRRVLEQDLDVARPRLAAVDAVGAARLALDAAGDLDLVAVVEFRRRAALAVVEEDGHFRGVARRARIGAREDHVVHGGGAHALVRGLAHHPAERFQKIGFAAAVRADDAGQTGLDDELGRFDERLEAQQPEARDLHFCPCTQRRERALRSRFRLRQFGAPADAVARPATNGSTMARISSIVSSFLTSLPATKKLGVPMTPSLRPRSFTHFSPSIMD